MHPRGAISFWCFGEGALTTSCPHGGTKAELKHQHRQLLLSPFWLLAPKGPPSPSPVPAVCLLCLLVPFLALASWAGELRQGCGSVLTPHSFKAPTPPETSLRDHMVLSPEPLAGLYLKLWDTVPASHSPPKTLIPVRDFTGRGKDGFQLKNLATDL